MRIFIVFVFLKKLMKTRRKDKLRCTAVPDPCVQLLIRRITSCFWSLHIFTSEHLHLNHPPFWLLGVVTSWSGTGNENFWKWNGSFRLDWIDQSKRTTLTWKFPSRPNRSIYLWTEISGNFCHNGKQPKSPCFDLFMLWLIKLILNTSPNPFFRVIRRSNGLIAKRSIHFGYWYLPRVFWNF